MKRIHRYNSIERQHFLLHRHSSFTVKPKLLYAGILSKKAGWRDRLHSHSFAELMFVTQGKGRIYYDRDARDISSGDLVIYNGGVPHREKSSLDQPMELLFVGLDRIELSGLPPNALLPQGEEIVYHTGEMDVLFRHYFSNLVDEMARKNKFYSEVAKNDALTLVIYVYRLINRFRQTEGMSRENTTLEQVVAYLDQHFSEEITLDQVASHCHISKYYLSHLFSDQKQMTVGEYVLQKRMEQATLLLTGTKRTVSDIALSSGFNDASYFSRTFKKQFHLSPLAYRKQQLQAGK